MKANFLGNKKYRAGAVLICLMFFCLAFFSVSGFNFKDLKKSGMTITVDEVSHISVGYYYFKTGRYFLNIEHPPLVKDISAIPFLFLKPAFPAISSDLYRKEKFFVDNYPQSNFVFPQNLEFKNDQLDWAALFLFDPQNNVDLLVLLSRLSIIIANCIVLYLIFHFLSKLWNEKASLVSLFLIATSQFLIAHGSLVTMDFLSSALQMATLLCFALYLKKYIKDEKGGRYLALTILFLTLANLAKFSSVVLIPAMFISGLIYVIASKRSGKWAAKFILRFVSLNLAVLFLITIYYCLHLKNVSTPELLVYYSQNYPRFSPIYLYVIDSLAMFGTLTRGLSMYFFGLMQIFDQLTYAYQTTYFLGHVHGQEGAGNWYFPALYFTKLSIGFLLLNLIAVIYLIRNFFRNRKNIRGKLLEFFQEPAALALVMFGIAYLFVAFSSTFQIGLRHIMPIIFVIALLTAKAISKFWNEKIFALKMKYVFGIIFILLFISVLASFPYYLSYFNAFGGGTNNGYKIATDSNYDWGQDIKNLAKWTDENNIEKIYAHLFTAIPPKFYLGDKYELYNIEWWPLPPSGSYIAVSAYQYENNLFRSGLPDDKRWTVLGKPVARIGATIFIFRVP
jgi:hypothetical protein